MKPLGATGRVYTLSGEETFMRRTSIFIVGTLSVAFAASGADTRPAGMAAPTRIPDVERMTPAPVGQSVTPSEIPREVRRTVVADAAKRFRVAESSVVLTRAERVTWNDGAMGCAEPGRSYTQALLPGYRIIAKTTGGELVYHTDSRGSAVNCSAKPMVPLADPADSRKASEPRTGPPPRTAPDR
jgi:hypothetical protein